MVCMRIPLVEQSLQIVMGRVTVLEYMPSSAPGIL
jgi:hypothetical protein